MDSFDDEHIFIISTEKSGSTLIRNLFDSHPDLYVLPFETHFAAEAFGRPFEEAKENYRHIVNKANSVKPRFDEVERIGLVDMAVFNATLDAEEIDSYPRLFNTYFQAIHKGETKKDLYKRVVEKSVTTHPYVLQLADMYPRAKFIRILRNPFSNIVSIRRAHTWKKYPYFYRTFPKIADSVKLIRKHRDALGERYHLVKYEELVSRPKEVMTELANFLEIEYTEDLEVPTFRGKIWTGNSSYNTKFSGISAENLEKWRKAIFPAEQFIIDRGLRSFLPEFYNREPIGFFRALRRSEGETLPRYVINRLYALWKSL